MKTKWLTGLMAAMVMLLCLGTALAYDDNTAGVANLPESVRTIAAEKWPGWEVTGWVNPAGVHTASACGFAALHRDSGNLLAAFGCKDGQWRYQWYNANALPQKPYGMELLEATAGGGVPAFAARELTSPAAQTVWTRKNADSEWLLTRYEALDTDAATVLETIAVHADDVVYTGWKINGGKSCTYSGETQRDLRYFSWNAFPKTPDVIKTKLSAAPDIPQGGLTAQKLQFTGGRKYEVYSAPDKDSLRGGNGKAKVSTNGWIQVFGQEDGWILIQYSIDSSHDRFGYIPASALPKKASVPELDFERVPAAASCTTSITDDPLCSAGEIGVLQRGEGVTWLATMGDWAYVEVTSESGLLRGFVTADHLAASGEAAADDADRFAVYSAENGEQYDLFTITRLHYTPDHRVTAVTGHYERIVMGEDCYESEWAPESAATYLLAPDFHAEMIGSMYSSDMDQVPVTDLYQWYVDAYMGRDDYDGHDLVFSCDHPEEDSDVNVDFWFVTTRIELNERGEVQYMEYVYVPWC